MNRKAIKAFLALTLFFNSIPAYSEDYKAKNLIIENPWARATFSGVPIGAIYLRITNRGMQPDTLLGASNPNLAKKIDLNDHIHENGIMKMREVSQIDIPAKNTIELQPHGYHIMLTGLKKPLKAGEKIPVTLRFKQAGQIKIDVSIKPIDTHTEMSH